jgi:hypothetical protein
MCSWQRYVLLDFVCALVCLLDSMEVVSVSILSVSAPLSHLAVQAVHWMDTTPAASQPGKVENNCLHCTVVYRSTRSGYSDLDRLLVHI